MAWLKSIVTAADMHGGGWVQIIFHQVCFRISLNYNQCMASYRPVDAAVLRGFLD